MMTMNDDVTAYLVKEDGGQESERNSVSGLLVDPRNTDVWSVPDLLFPVVHFPQRRRYVEQNDFRIAVNQPATVNNLHIPHPPCSETPLHT